MNKEKLQKNEIDDLDNKKTIIKGVIKIALLLSLLFGFYLLIQDSPEQTKSNDGIQYGAGNGSYVYDYELKEINGDKTYKISDFRGKNVFLFFWASWCPYCKQTVPSLQEISEERDDIVIIGINVTSVEGNSSDAINFIDEQGLTYLNVTAPDKMYEDFHIKTFPTSVFVNSEGIIEEGVLGGLSKEMIELRFETIK